MANKPRKYKTTFLFRRTSFLIGCGSVFNVSGNYFVFNYSKSGLQADAKAIENDWDVIGQDLKDTIRKVSNKQLVLAE